MSWDEIHTSDLLEHSPEFFVVGVEALKHRGESVKFARGDVVVHL